MPVGRGGARKGAGRPPKHQVAGVGHDVRAAMGRHSPVHVTVKLRRGLPKLRRNAAYAALRSAFGAGCRGTRALGAASSAKGAFRLCHYAVLNDHLHFILEAHDRTALTRGLQGLLIRIAKVLNKLWTRRGGVFADRYHDRILKSPREVRLAIRYVLQNGKKHEAEGLEVRVTQAIDIFTSAPWFDGFRERFTVRELEKVPRPVAAAKSWLLRTGWRKHGLISVWELPASA
jgi:hypothetical protein